jgi:hypothetical protein
LNDCGLLRQFGAVMKYVREELKPFPGRRFWRKLAVWSADDL